MIPEQGCQAGTGHWHRLSASWAQALQEAALPLRFSSDWMATVWRRIELVVDPGVTAPERHGVGLLRAEETRRHRVS